MQQKRHISDPLILNDYQKEKKRIQYDFDDAQAEILNLFKPRK